MIFFINVQSYKSGCKFLLFFYIPVYVRYSYMYSEMNSQRAREKSLLHNLERNILLLTNYNQNAHNFLNYTSVWQRVNNSPTSKEHSLFQLDVHKCNSKENNSDCVSLNTKT